MLLARSTGKEPSVGLALASFFLYETPRITSNTSLPRCHFHDDGIAGSVGAPSTAHSSGMGWFLSSVENAPLNADHIISSRILATASGASANWSNFSKKVSSFIQQSRRWR